MNKFTKLAAALGLLLATLLLKSWGPGLISLLGIGTAAGGAGAYILIGLELLLWIAAVILLCMLVRLIIWDGLLRRATGRPAPALIKQMSDVFVVMLATLFAVHFVFEQNIIAFVTALGAIGVVLSLGLKELISDLMTGLAINLEHSFSIGDWVSIQDGQVGTIIGQVTQINWRTTHLIDEDKCYYVVPNREIGNSAITVYSNPTALTRYDIPVELDYTVPVEEAKRILLSAASALIEQPGFAKHPAPSVIVSGFPASGVEYTVRYWIHAWQNLSPTLGKDMVMSRILHHLRLAGLTPSYAKLEYFNVSPPDVLAQPSVDIELPKLLANMNFFAPLTEKEVAYVVKEGVNHIWEAGDTVISQGDKGESMFVVLQGLLGVHIKTDKGREKRVGQIQAGEIFGEMSLLTGEARSATIKAVTPVKTVEITKPIFSELLAKRPVLGKKLSELMADRQTQSQSVLAAKDRKAAQNKARQIYKKMRAFLKIA